MNIHNKERTIEELVIASCNKNKLKEIKLLLKDFSINLYTQSEFGIFTSYENNNTFIENAISKARHVSRITGLPTLAEDSGLCVRSLQNSPGIFSARYASLNNNADDKLNNNLLIENLRGVNDRRAYYISIVVLLNNANDPKPIICEGILEGEIIDTASGNNGFGYDPHFFIPSIGKTIASISTNEKNQISHRAIAFNKFISELKKIDNQYFYK